MSAAPRRALVTGASGYVGPALIDRLLSDGWQVRALVRDKNRLRHDWADAVEVAVGDVGDAATLAPALEGVDVAYYLVHAMSDGDDYAGVDRRLAATFAAACEKADVGRLVYLGGLHPDDEPLTEHLESRREVGEILLACSVPTAVLRAGVVIGRGSASFEMLRYAVESTPLVVGPSWLDHHVQPIAADDLLRYLVACADLPPDVDRAFDVGGPEVVTYRELLARYADAAGSRPRPVITLPVLLPHTTSALAGMLAPGRDSLVAALVHSLSVDMMVGEHDIAEHVPDPADGLLGVDAALQRAFSA